MMLDARPLELGDLLGTVYHFQPGDVLSAHWHEDDTNHITVVTFGTFDIFGEDESLTIKTVEATPRGTIINWMPLEWHGFKAKTEGSIVNIRKKMTHGR